VVIPNDTDSFGQSLCGLHAGWHAVHEGDPVQKKVLHKSPELLLAAHELLPVGRPHSGGVVDVGIPQHVWLHDRPAPGLMAVVG